VTVQVYWQALAEMSESYKVFAHVVDSTGTIVGQSDFIPRGGAAPTTSWISGEVISDTIRVQFPETASAQAYQLIIGLYSSTTGARLPVARDGGREDSLVLSEIKFGE
jgi:hypothetical protein